MPVEIMLLPKWFPFHLDKVSYWARTVLVPMLVLMAKKPRAKNRLGVHIGELFVTPPEEVRQWPKGEHQTFPWTAIFGAVDRLLHVVEPFFPKSTRERAIALAESWTTERLNGVDGLGAIFPAMVNSLLMYDVLGVPAGDARVGPRANRSSGCSSFTSMKPIASPASRRSGTPRWSRTLCWKRAERRRARASKRRSNGWRRCKFSM